VFPSATWEQEIQERNLVEQSFEQADDGKKKLMAKNLAAFSRSQVALGNAIELEVVLPLWGRRVALGNVVVL